MILLTEPNRICIIWPMTRPSWLQLKIRWWPGRLDCLATYRIEQYRSLLLDKQTQRPKVQQGGSVASCQPGKTKFYPLSNKAATPEKHYAAGAKQLLEKIRELPFARESPDNECCGGHERSILHGGLRTTLPHDIELIPDRVVRFVSVLKKISIRPYKSL